MGYSENDLKDSLLTMFQSQSNPNTMEQHFKDLAKIYDDYCKDAMDNIASNTLVSTGKNEFESVFSTYPSSNPSLTIYSTYIENACIAYWDACVFNTINVPSTPKVVATWDSLLMIEITAMVTNSIKTSLETAFVSAKGDELQLSTDMANIIHSATSTVSLLLKGTLSGSDIETTALLTA